MPLCSVPLNSNNVKVSYSFQDDCEKLNDNPVFKPLSFTGGVPAITRDVLQSAELDGTSEITNIRLGSFAVAGDSNVELKAGVHDDMLEACMQSAWIAGETLASATVTIDADLQTATITGVDITSQVNVNDYVAFTELTGYNSQAHLVTAITFSTDTVITFGAAKVANPQTGRVGLTDESAASVGKTSDYINVGTQRKPFAMLIEHKDLDDTDRYVLIMDCEVTQFSFNPSVNSNITGAFSIIGKTMASGIPLPAGATFDPQTAKKPLTGIDGSIVSAGARIAFSESMTFSLNRNGEASYEIGSKYMAFIDYGKATNEVSITSKFVNFDIQQKFEAETNVDYSFAAALDGDLLAFQWPNCLLTGVDRTIGEGVIPQELTIFPYKPAGSTSSLTIRRMAA
jgi:hypothetical protein